MILKNPWVGYVERSYEQMKATILSKIAITVPEITDHTDSNPKVRDISIWSGLMELLHYYIDRKAREVFLSTATKYISVAKIASMFDYRIRGTLAASVDLKFYVEVAAGSDITIPTGTRVATRDGIEFVTLSAGTITAGDMEVIIPAKQWVQVANVNLGNSTGLAGQKIELAAGVVDSQISLLVGLTQYEGVETFAYTYEADEVYVAGLNEAAKMEIRFGDNINGKIPPTGAAFTCTYYTSLGEQGNVAPGTLTEIQGTITVPSGVVLKVTNLNRASGGADAEGIAQLKKRIPLSIRTLMRAVTRQDYIDIATLAPGVAQAGLIFTCGKTVDIYIAPEGGGIASSSLLITTKDYIEERSMVTTNERVFPAGEVQIKLIIDLFVLSNYLRASTRQLAIDTLLAFLSVNNQRIGGRVEMGDIYEQLENTEGVDYSRLIRMTTIPYARPVLGTSTLDWDRETLIGSNIVVRWRINLINSTQFELIKDSNFIGTFSIGNQVALPEIAFTINAGAYTVGDSWEFYTYKYNGSIQLVEQSVPVAYVDTITINAFGGLA